MDILRTPAIISNIGDWRCYITSLTFEQINLYVSKLSKELHSSKTLSDLIQRSITNNFKKISSYILEHDDRFFNSVVLAVYEGDPQYREIDFEFDNIRYGTMGLLEFTGHEIIFPVDGQHRVEGIKKALEVNPSLAKDRIPVIFIGHRNDQNGKERTRRLFSTLNRYAKPVKKSDIIAIDEDDVIAITTRHLVNNNDLFQDDRISLLTTLQDNDPNSFTTIETLYDCNEFLLTDYIKKRFSYKHPIDDYLRTRPSDREIEDIQRYCEDFWLKFTNTFTDIKQYLGINESAAKIFRNRQGGNLLFRPAGLSPFVKVLAEINKRTNKNYEQILSTFKNINMSMNAVPWKFVLWNEAEGKVNGKNRSLIESIFLFIYHKHSDPIMTSKEIERFKIKYSKKLLLHVEDIDEALEEI